MLRDHHVRVALDADCRPCRSTRRRSPKSMYILLDNASKYSPIGSAIMSAAERHDERTVELHFGRRARDPAGAARARVRQVLPRSPGGSRATPGAAASASVCRSRAAWWRRRRGRSGSIRRHRGRGTAIVLTLPISADTPRPPRSPAPMSRRRNGSEVMGMHAAGAPDESRVLVVDDEPQITRVLRTVLTSHGYQVRTAAEGESALAKLRNGARNWSSPTCSCRTWTASSCAAASAPCPACRSSCCR